MANISEIKGRTISNIEQVKNEEIIFTMADGDVYKSNGYYSESVDFEKVS